jgi:L-arabinonolactonase
MKAEMTTEIDTKMTTETLNMIVDGRHELGEGVQWCERSGRVFWTDIEGACLHCHDPATGVDARWPMPERLANFAFTANPNLLLIGLASRLAWFDLRTGEVTPIMDIEADLPRTRLNDARCDRQGRFVFGTMDDGGNDRTAIGSFYRLNTDLTLERLPLPKVAISNSVCFSPDGATMYFCDTMDKIIYRWDGYLSGDASAISVFADVRNEPGSPDGSAIDAEGRLWNAAWGAGRVVRFAPDGSIERSITLDASQPSCLCFGGEGFGEMFVTTAWQHMTPPMRAAEPHAGGLHHAAVGVRGLPEGRFGGLPAGEPHAQA